MDAHIALRPNGVDQSVNRIIKTVSQTPLHDRLTPINAI
ncbi:hypothetical protein SDC9_210459 [bioreactor metagenome]|uniref:Uncharacterized protein n=1 Tax=bioreactor metagenome TaxID=1076179 RepID=A0A645JGZ3_9ZZZZ